MLLETNWLDDDDEDDNDDILGIPSISLSTAKKAHIAQDLLMDQPDLDHDESNALLKQVQEETAVETKYDSFHKQREEDLFKRYEAFKNTKANFDTRSSEQNIISSAPRGAIPKPIHPEDLHDELEDWCGICNDDATLICDDCEGEKYCNTCFYEGHRGEMADYESTKHIARKYVRKGNNIV
ncbi:hypothetical protein BCR43DRAFT_483692 [Syncephalastrum racemosum]|uniref:Uncharacterized protein n=1 Tax=Syncephalastrum racemosum TaxID=13706 RepID=A0A1X2HVR8_SYNRA|nr:hypothetical protein BCR43DRAFT_483692 [Syncephalastrum racemosum]